MVAVARKTDEDDQVVDTAMVVFAVGGPFDRFDILLTLLTSLHISLLRNLHVGQETHRSRVDAVDAKSGCDHPASAVVYGIEIITAFAFHDGEAVGIMQVVVKLVARGKTLDDLAIGLGEANGNVLQRSGKGPLESA